MEKEGKKRKKKFGIFNNFVILKKIWKLIHSNFFFCQNLLLGKEQFKKRFEKSKLEMNDGFLSKEKKKT